MPLLPLVLSRPNSTRRPARPRARWLRLGPALAGLLAALPAQAVLLANGDGTGNTSPPPTDPGFANVGAVNGLSGVYVRNGWVLTAGHVGAHPITLGGETFTPSPGSGVRFQNPDGSDADLLAFKLTSHPPLPDLRIANAPPSLDESVVVIGNGRDRGDPVSWRGSDGFQWGTGRSIRWGTNRISDIDELTLNTLCFWTIFESPGSWGSDENEADIVEGDSGGGAFTAGPAPAELVGILFARAAFLDQPESTSLYGNAGLAVDLYAYRDQILSLIDQPACSDGFDDDGDGLVDLEDPGCSDPTDSFERGPAYECDNGLDDDGDDLFDFPEDDGCLHPTNLIEAPEPGFSGALPVGAAALAALRRRRLRSRRYGKDNEAMAMRKRE